MTATPARPREPGRLPDRRPQDGHARHRRDGPGAVARCATAGRSSRRASRSRAATTRRPGSTSTSSTFDDVREPGDGFVLEADGATSDPFVDRVRPLRRPARRLARRVLRPAQRHRDRRGAARPRVRARGRPRRRRPQPRRRRGRVPPGGPRDDGGRRRPVRRLDRRLHPRRDGRLVRRRRPGQVRRQRRHRRRAAARHCTSARCAHRRRRTRSATARCACPSAATACPDVLDEARWELDWMLRMRSRRGSGTRGMVHHKVSDERWTGLPTLPADDPQPRYLHRPSTAATLNLAAVAAQGARVFAPLRRGVRRAPARRRARRLRRGPRAPGAARARHQRLANAGSGPYDDDDVEDDVLLGRDRAVPDDGRRAVRRRPAREPVHAPLFRPDGFDWNHVAALVAARARDGRRARCRSGTPSGRPSSRPPTRYRRAAGHAAVRPPVRARRPAGTTGAPTAWSSTTSPCSRPRTRSPATRRTATRVLRGVDYLFGRNALERLLRHRLRHARRPQPAQPLVRPPARPDPAAPAARHGLGRPELRLPGPGLGGARGQPGAVLLRRRHRRVRRQRDDDQLELGARVGRGVPGRTARKELDIRVSWAHRHRPGHHR